MTSAVVAIATTNATIATASPIPRTKLNSPVGGVATSTFTVANAVSAGTPVIVYAYDTSSTLTGATITHSKCNTYTKITSVTAVSTINGNVFYSVITIALTASDHHHLHREWHNQAKDCRPLPFRLPRLNHRPNTIVHLLFGF
jgi:hypothetical protein